MDRSPRILEVSWGHMDVEGLGAGKDFKLYPGGGREWDWSETSTRHSPGIQPADVEELIANGATTIILSRGMDLVLETDPRTLDLLAAASITVHVLETREAVELYNTLAATTPSVDCFTPPAEACASASTASSQVLALTWFDMTRRATRVGARRNAPLEFRTVASKTRRRADVAQW